MLICVLTNVDDTPAGVLVGITQRDLDALHNGLTALAMPEKTGLAAPVEVFLVLGDAQAQVERVRAVASAGGAPQGMLYRIQIDDEDTPS